MKLVNPLPRDVSYVYHYTGIDTALNYILKNGTLKLNSFSNVNDPRESKEWDMSPFVRLHPRRSPEQHDAISREVSDLLKENAKLICFSKDKKEAIGRWAPEALFGRGFAKPSMWHHYGGKHDGLCLMFDKKKLQQALAAQLDQHRLMSGEVQYSNQGILARLEGDPFIIDLTAVVGRDGYFATAQAHLNRWFPELFLRKLVDWAHEDEYRWVYLDTHPEPRYVAFNDSLEAVVIGEHVATRHTEDILRYCAKYCAEVADLRWRNGFPQLRNLGQPYLTHRHLLDEKKASALKRGCAVLLRPFQR